MNTININTLGSNMMQEGFTYNYENEYGNFNIMLLAHTEMLTEYNILCHADQFISAVKKIVDLYPVTYETSSFDLSACVYDVAQTILPLFKLNACYFIRVDIVELRTTTMTADELAVLPFFNLKESRRIVKGFQDFR